jgi:hypothetical protein
MTFYSEGLKQYQIILDNVVENAITRLNSNKSISYSFVNLKLFDTVKITSNDKSKNFKIHELHYGPIWNKNKQIENESDVVYYWRKFITRDRFIFMKTNEDLSLLTLFQKKQMELVKKNYFLVDLSDTKYDTEKDKVFYDIKIVLYKTKPHKPIKRWHSYGYIPTLGTPTITKTKTKSHNNSKSKFSKSKFNKSKINKSKYDKSKYDKSKYDKSNSDDNLPSTISLDKFIENAITNNKKVSNMIALDKSEEKEDGIFVAKTPQKKDCYSLFDDIDDIPNKTIIFRKSVNDI